ncbi:DUF488 domain-containing protein [Patescibacteria group bacterium]|nr:DUF488 domain-containing protein [Patescibacteria group bacterium]
MLKTKRIYDEFEKSDGFRVLVDRLWPRGISKEKAKIDLWLKEVAPSRELRKWFQHDPQKWKEFLEKYKDELGENLDAVETVKKILVKQPVVTLVYAAKDTQHNNAVALAEYFHQNLLKERKS